MKSDLGQWGEAFAANWLRGKGLEILDRNRQVGRSEVDLVASDAGHRVFVEVRTISGPGDPIDAVDIQKRQHVRSLAGGSRVDFIGIGVRGWGVEVHWMPGG